MDLSSAAEWVSDMQARSHLRTDKLDAIYKRDPELGEQIENLCVAVRAAAAHAMQAGAVHVVNLCREATAPFKVPDANDAMMSEVASWFSELAPKTVNTTGHTGVVFNKARGKYQASIKIDGRKTYLGLFATPEEAGAAYEKARQRAHAG